MATVNVSTWDEIANALTNVSEDTTVQITKNIDMNLEYAEGVVSVVFPSTFYKVTLTGAHAPTFESGKYYQQIISGDDETYTVLNSEPLDWNSNYTHYFEQADEDSYEPVKPERYNIRNLRNDSTETNSIFNANACDFILESIDFQNLVLAGASFTTAANTVNGLRVHNCRFVGSRSGAAYMFNYSHSTYVKLVSCYLNVPWMGMNAAASAAGLAYTALGPKWLRTDSNTCSWSASYTHFVEHYSGWNVPTPSTTNQDNSEFLVYSCQCFQLNACKLTGDMTLGATTSVTTSKVTIHVANVITPKSVMNGFIPMSMSICNVKLSIVVGAPDWSKTNEFIMNEGNFFGIQLDEIVCADGSVNEFTIKGSAIMGDGSKPYAKGVTSRQIKDINTLYRVGFDVIPPES